MNIRLQDFSVAPNRTMAREKPAFDFGAVLDQVEAASSDLATHLLDIQEYERRRISQDLHDSAGQLVVCLQMSIARLMDRHPEFEPSIQEIQAIARELNDQIRFVSFLDYPLDLTNQGVSSAIESYARALSSRTGIKTSFRALGDVDSIDLISAAALLRVTQEALVNVHRHSHATTAKVALRRRMNSVSLSISDNGLGLRPKGTQTFGIGVQIMRHRVENAGGKFRLSNGTRGAKVFAKVPTCHQ